MAKFGLIKSFSIDDGELDGMTPQECFVLGYELAQIDNRLKSGESFSQMVHLDNRTRIEDACRDAGRTFKVSWLDNDPAESWLSLTVDTK